jgi:hypothetical protein
MNTISPDIQQSWFKVEPILSISNEQDYAAAIDRLNMLIDEVETHEQHPLYPLLDTLGTLIHAYIANPPLTSSTWSGFGLPAKSNPCLHCQPTPNPSQKGNPI